MFCLVTKDVYIYMFSMFFLKQLRVCIYIWIWGNVLSVVVQIVHITTVLGCQMIIWGFFCLKIVWIIHSQFCFGVHGTYNGCITHSWWLIYKFLMSSRLPDCQSRRCIYPSLVDRMYNYRTHIYIYTFGTQRINSL